MANKQEGWTLDEDLGMDEATTAPPGPLENAVYKFEFESVEAHTTKSGKPAVKLKLKATERYQGAAVERGGTVFDLVVVEKATNWKVKQLAEAAGVNPPSKSNFEQVAQFIEDLLGAGGCLAKTKRSPGQGENKGKMFTNIDNYLTETQANEAVNGAASAAASQPSAARPVRKRGQAVAASA